MCIFVGLSVSTPRVQIRCSLFQEASCSKPHTSAHKQVKYKKERKTNKNQDKAHTQKNPKNQTKRHHKKSPTKKEEKNLRNIQHQPLIQEIQNKKQEKS